ncbi:MAG: histidinol phosphate phosphatase domain-containing protein [Hadesarchaea archaeon]|jgi:histidinol phosphatase-like PHP family hydrolase|nr:histidinol phosphate phosphatase domain-containing protein [Hadesarchaea archaeon]TDA31664.1 MAG: PHP domain-containing protein [Hadesarchaea archaeon]
MRVELHTHSLLSDGAVLPVELARRAEAKGHAALAITDHVDPSNLETLLPALLRAAEEVNRNMGIRLLPGVELTHLPPSSIGRMARRARKLGAALVVVHGESPVEPVPPGTNEAALSCGEVDLLAHPGFLTRELAGKAGKAGVYLELTSRRGHSLTNGWVARVALEEGCKLLVNSDAHEPEDLLTQEEAKRVALGAGLEEREAERAVTENPRELLKRLGY